MTTAPFTSTRNLNAAQTFEVIQPGMKIEYSDPENDMDKGNFAIVLDTEKEVGRKAFTGVPFYRYLVHIQLDNLKQSQQTISAGQILAYAN